MALQVGVLPARYQSSRFPGKPLVLLLGKPMILHTYEQVDGRGERLATCCCCCGALKRRAGGTARTTLSAASIPSLTIMILPLLPQACRAASLDAVVVATDDERIAEVCRAAGAPVVMTRPDCANGGWVWWRGRLRGRWGTGVCMCGKRWCACVGREAHELLARAGLPFWQLGR